MLDNYSLLSFIQFYFIFFFSPLSKLVFSVYFFNDSMHSVLSQPNKVSNNNRKSFITFVFAIIACIEEDKSISLGWIFPTLASGKTIFSQLLYLLLLQLYENWKRNAHSYSNLFRSTLKTIFFLFREQNCISFFLKFFLNQTTCSFSTCIWKNIEKSPMTFIFESKCFSGGEMNVKRSQIVDDRLNSR